MQLKRWIFALPVFIVVIVGCAHPLDALTTNTSTQSATIAPVTSTPDPIVSEEIETPTIQNSWYVHPETNPDAIGRSYGFLDSSQVSIYETLEDAVSHAEQFRKSPNPPAYLAYDQAQTVDGKSYVHLTDGGWMPMEELGPVKVTSFSGLIISETPPQTFGWVIQNAVGWTDPSTEKNSGLDHTRYEVVSVFEQKNGFARLETNDWLPLNDLALVDLNKITTPPPSSCRWVDVDLTSQTLVVFEKCKPVFATLISSAKAPSITPLGTFSFFYKEERLPLFANERVASSESFYLADVPWLMFFYENWAIHGAYWHDNFGEPWSHGCINVSPYDALWLFNWSKLGDMIVIHE